MAMAAAANGSSIFESEQEQLQGQILAWNLTFGFVSSMAVKAACLLRIPDILASEGHGAALTLPEIASRISRSSSSPISPEQSDYLHRILRFLCSQGFFSFTTAKNSEPKYGLTAASKWLVQRTRNGDPSFAPFALMVTDSDSMAPWHHLSECVSDGGFAFEKAHGVDLWSFANKHPEFNKLFNDAMAYNSDFRMQCLLQNYHGFASVDKLVDVGGGVGAAAAMIAAQHPSIKAINFDLPHVVATAPNYPGVEQVGGDMFDSVPSTGSVFMKSVMHNWDDERCLKILKNCRKAISDTGKVILLEGIVETEKEGSDKFNPTKLMMDLLMIAHTSGGKERTKAQWVALLSSAGFPRHNFIRLPSFQSVIEAFPS